MAKVALLIGISEYDEPTLARLPNAVHDVEAMERVLLNSEMGDFDAVKVATGKFLNYKNRRSNWCWLTAQFKFIVLLSISAVRLYPTYKD